MYRESQFHSISGRNPNIQQFDVVIIGAGLSGLTAAFRLFQLKPNLTVTILEAKDRVGGRIQSVELPATNNSIDVWDLGGSWIGNQTIQPFINQLLSELNIQVYPQWFQGKKCLQTGKNFKIIKYESRIPNIGLLSLYDTFKVLRHVDSVQKKLFRKSGLSSKDEDHYDSITAKTFFNEKTLTQSTSDCLDAAMRATFGAEQNRLSALFAMKYINSCNSFLNLFESSETSSQGYKISGGAQRICSRILEIINSDKLQLEKIVTSITEIIDDKDERYSIIETLCGDIYRAKNVILSVPTHLITNIQFQPCLSPTKYEFFSSVVPGHLIKIILTYDKAFWRDFGYSGEIVTNGGKSFTGGCDNGPLCVVFDATTDNNSPALLGLIGGKQAFEYESKTKEERKEAVLVCLEKFFKKSDVRNFIVYCEKIWRHESFVGGCPVSHVPTGVGKHLNSQLRQSEHGIHFAVSDLAEHWIGFMEGAVESGEKAALEILSAN